MDTTRTIDPITIPERVLRPWVEWWHGKRDAPHQYDFYRCKGCRGIVNWNKIHRGGCGCDTGKHLVPAKLSFLEKARILVLPWTL